MYSLEEKLAKNTVATEGITERNYNKNILKNFDLGRTSIDQEKQTTQEFKKKRCKPKGHQKYAYMQTPRAISEQEKNS